ncbi:MAG TPA: hypothetical protein VF691_02525 [Cytophagaceae bacterium]|jgi:hypothetical protein
MKLIHSIAVSLIMVLCLSCDEFIEKDISKEKIVVNAPLTNRSDMYTQTFWWEEVKSASGYRLQIVFNKFDSLPLFRLDTLVKSTKFTVTLRPAKYQWRLWAENGSSRSDTVYNNITIDSTSITKQVVNVTRTSPASTNRSVTTNKPTVTFYWDRLEGAFTYQLEIVSDTGTRIIDAGKKLNYTLTMSSDGTYTVSIIGKNTRGEKSQPSEPYEVILDRNGPGRVELNSPIDGNQIPTASDSVILSWNKLDGAVKYFLYVNQDSTGLSNKQAIETSNLSYTYRQGSNPINEKIYWMVVGEDANKNKGAGSLKRSFIFR